MNKHLLPALCVLLLTLAIACGASAEPLVTNGTHTAYIGESNYLYLENETGAVMVLHAAISDLVSINASQLYCLTAEGKLYAVMLDGSSTSIVSAAPTEADLAAVAAVPAFTLTNGTLSIPGANGIATAITGSATLAAANSTNLYYMETNATGETLLKTVPLTSSEGLTSAITTLGAGVANALSMTASDDALAIVGPDHAVTLVSLTDNSQQVFPAVSQNTSKAVCQGAKLILYTQDDKGLYTVETTLESGLTAIGGDAARSVGATATPTAAPTAGITVTNAPSVNTATPAPATTAKPTAKPTSSTSGSTDDGSIRKGARGSRVRKMQQRLSDLGYPVGTVDGSFGDNTLLAVNLFQDAIGYRERSYASTSMLDKLYATNAPTYDPYAPLKLGDSGTNVLLMQTALHDLGYDPGKLDGIYGKGTKAAVELFQFVCGLPVTGDADRDTMTRLFDVNAPVNPGTITPTPTPGPIIIIPATRTDLT